MASIEAIERRRTCRRLAKAAKSHRRKAVYVARSVREMRDRKVAERMCIRFFKEPPDPLKFDIRGEPRYWQLRRCGWDVMSRKVRLVGLNADGSDILSDPRDTVEWRWWISLHYQERQACVDASTFRIVR